MLPKKQYLAQKKATFDRLRLTSQQRDMRYAKYAARYKSRTSAPQTKVRITSNPVMSNTPRQQRNPVKASTVRLSDCLLAYAGAQLAPYNYTGPDPCIPDNICAPSYKFNASCKTEMYIGVDGCGYALINPWTAAITGCNDYDCPVITTTPAFTGTSIKWNNPVDYPAQVKGTNANSQFALTYVSGGKMRLVAAGAELIYAGKVVDQAGVITTLQNDGLKVWVPGTDVSSIKNNPRAIVCANSKIGVCHVNYYPTNADVISYRQFEDFLPSAANGVDPYKAGPIMGIFVLGGTPGTAFEVRFKAFFELQLAGMNVTPSHSDPIGLGAYQTARTMVVPTSNPRADLATVLKQTMHEIGSSVSGILPYAGTAIGSIFGQPGIGAALGTAGSIALNTILQADPTPI